MAWLDRKESALLMLRGVNALYPGKPLISLIVVMTALQNFTRPSLGQELKDHAPRVVSTALLYFWMH
jgi:hypothetical protein